MALTYIQKTVHPTPITLHESNGVAYFTFPLLEQTRMVRHAFSTRLGGASKGYFSTMNFSLTRGDNRDDVLENYRKMARILGTDVSKMVLSHQTHTTNIRLVTEADAGKGIWRERDYENIDGLITNVPGLTLVTFFADCVPLYFVDPVHRAIGLSHSGWKGTVHRMGQKTIYLMANGSMLNLTAGFGDSLNAFDVTLAVMASGIRHIVTDGMRAPAKVYLLPQAVWQQAL